VGPNQYQEHNWNDFPEHGCLTIFASPGKTNMSHEVKITGWLGTSNDMDETALGEFDSLELARKKCEELGYTIPDDSEDFKPIVFCKNDDEIESWLYPELCKTNAADWLQYDNDIKKMITPKTTDEEIHKIADDFDNEALTETGEGFEHGIELMYTEEFLKQIREEKIEELEYTEKQP